MKSFIFAAIFSIALVSGSSVLSKKIEKATESLSLSNHELYIYLENKDTKNSLSCLEATEKEFRKHKVLFEATADHEEILRIELHYGAIREFIKEKQFGDALASCSEIELHLSHLPSNFELKGENIL